MVALELRCRQVEASRRDVRRVVALTLLAVLALAEAAAAGISSLQLVEQSSPNDSSDWKEVAAPCPPGTVAFSGGVSLATALPVAVLASAPLGDPPTQWVATAQEQAPTAGAWSLVAFAFCGTVGGFEQVSAASPVDSTSPKGLVAACPPGKVTIGGGGRIVGTSTSLVLADLGPFGSGWSAVGLERPSDVASWGVEVTVSCAPGVDVDALQADNANRAEEIDTIDLFCPSDRLAIAGGTTMANGRLLVSKPLPPFGWNLAARRLDGAAGSLWYLSGPVLCFRP